MPIAAIYDIHGNLPALEAVLAEIDDSGADEIVVGGDVIPGPMPRETLALLRDIALPIRFIRGNGEREVLAERAGKASDAIPPRFREVMRWVAEQLTPADAAELESWPGTIRTTVAGLGTVLFCHATPRNDTDIFTARTPDDVLRPLFDGLGAAAVVCGHTHMQFDRTVGGVRVVNAGSVGMPFGAPGAYWALVGPAIELRHTSYDRAAAADRVRGTTYPQAAEFAGGNILDPPASAAMLDVLGRAELKPAAVEPAG
jgi:putative phosphoesterase